MPSNNERLILSQTISPEHTSHALEVLTPTLEALRVYFKERQAILDAAIPHLGTSSLYEEEVLTELDMLIDVELSADYSIITGDGDVLVGPWLSMHLMDISEPGDFVTEPRAQLASLAGKIAKIDMHERPKFVVATTYPKLARLAQKLTGMEYAVATYFPSVTTADEILPSILQQENAYRKKNRLKRSKQPQIESLAMPTQAFIDKLS